MVITLRSLGRVLLLTRPWRRPAEAMAQASNFKVGCYFLLWYALNVMYNDANMTILKVLDLPWTMAALQLGLGLLYVVPKWATGLGKVPRLSLANLQTIAPIAMIHGAGQCVTVRLHHPHEPAAAAPLESSGRARRRCSHAARVRSPSSTSSSRSSCSSTPSSPRSAWATCCRGRRADAVAAQG